METDKSLTRTAGGVAALSLTDLCRDCGSFAEWVIERVLLKMKPETVTEAEK